MSLHACNDLTGLSAASDCTGRVSEHRSFRVVFPSYRGSAEDVEHLEASDLRGSCVPANAAGLAATSNTIPAGSDRFYLATEIQAFTSTDCSGDSYGYLFKNGLTRGDEDTETLVFDAGNITKVFLLYDEVSSPPPAPPTILGVNGNQDAIIDSIFSSNTPLTFHWTPQAGIQAYTIRVTNSLSATECSIVEFPGGVSQYAFSSCSPTTDDTLTVWMQARDAAGNLSPTTTFKFVNSWLTPLGQLPTARYGFKAVKNNLNQIILWGGYDGGLTSQGL
ncbi:MAG: hypothetical protein ACLGG7_13550, partial [Bacteriovoracia bacterium]